MRLVALGASRGRPRGVAANVDRPMVFEERGRGFTAHVAFEHSYGSHGQIHQDERVEAVVEVRVAREGKDPAADLQVLLEEDGHPALSAFELENLTLERGDILRLRSQGRRTGIEIRGERTPRSHKAREAR